MSSASLRILLAGLVDYAGLFPPASLSMAEVAANYAAYRQSPDAWVLGRLIVPVARLHELTEFLSTQGMPPGRRGVHDPSPGFAAAPDARSWRISALAGKDIADDARRIAAWNASVRDAVVDTVELRTSSPEMLLEGASALQDFTTYVEFPLDEDVSPYLDAIARTGLRAKIRTGGVTPEAFPTSAHIARFLRGCADRNLAFKATAGLHHPLRDSYRLTYAPDSPCGDMFGFLNVFVAAAFARKGLPERELIGVLEERNSSTLQFHHHGIRWRDEEIDAQRLADVRTSFAIAFGSCSFREPIDDLHSLGLL
jgi:hypothetical protein